MAETAGGSVVEIATGVPTGAVLPTAVYFTWNEPHSESLTMQLGLCDSGIELKNNTVPLDSIGMLRKPKPREKSENENWHPHDFYILTPETPIHLILDLQRNYHY